jgi:signal peptidase I
MQPEASVRKEKSKTRELVETVALALVLAFGVRATVAEARFIPSTSKVPTIQVDDRVLVDKVSYHLGSPRRGDIAVFRPPAGSGLGHDDLIKRVVGLPGEKIRVMEGKVFINGEALHEPYLNEAPNYTLPERTIPADSVFVMGDNRNNSADSHVWGYLPVENIIGKATFRYWPVPRAGLMD